MPNPNRHEQPAEGGVEQVEGALQKQSEPKPQPRKEPNTNTPKERKTDETR